MSSSSNILPRKSLLQGILHSSIILDSLPRVGLIFVSSSGILVFTCVCHRLPVSAFTRLLLTTMTATSTVLRMSGLLPQRIVVLQQYRLLSERTTASGACHRSVWCECRGCLPRHRSTGQATYQAREKSSIIRPDLRLLSERIMGPRACISVVLDNRELFNILKYKP